MRSPIFNATFIVAVLFFCSTLASNTRLQLEPGSKAVIKLGVCPYPNYLKRCGEVKDDCLDDLDCAHESLCCNDGCHRACATPRHENIVGYIVLGNELPLNVIPTVPPTAPALAPKSVAVSPESWNLLLGYLCAVADRLHNPTQFQCKIQCSQDSDCPQGGDQNNGGTIKCCNQCCLDPTQFIIQQRTNPRVNNTKFGGPQLHQSTFQDNYLGRSTTLAPPPSSKPGMCPPVLVQSNGGFISSSCDRRCNGDRDCYGPEKCCSNGCGYACQRPISFSMGYGGESLSAPIPFSNTFFSNPARSAADFISQTTTNLMRLNSPMPNMPRPVTTVAPPAPITVMLGAQQYGNTETAPSSQRCTLPPTSYTECIGISPWRTRYYYHKGLNQCLPIYRCIRAGNNFADLSSCENTCVEQEDQFF